MAWVVLCLCLKPNWKLDNIPFASRKLIKKFAMTFSYILEKNGSTEIGR